MLVRKMLVGLTIAASALAAATPAQAASASYSSSATVNTYADGSGVLTLHNDTTLPLPATSNGAPSATVIPPGGEAEFRVIVQAGPLYVQAGVKVWIVR